MSWKVYNEKTSTLNTSWIIEIFQCFVHNYFSKHITHCRIHVEFLHQTKSIKQLEAYEGPRKHLRLRGLKSH